MAKIFKTPAVYVEEVSFRSLSIAQVETAIPAFVGYTEKAEINGKSALNQALKVHSLSEFQSFFGGEFSPLFSLAPKTIRDQYTISIGIQDYGIALLPFQRAYLFHSVMDYFANGGRACYVVSVGTYSGKSEVKIKKEDLLGAPTSRIKTQKPKGLKCLEKVLEPTLVIIPDAVALEDQAFEIFREMLSHCHTQGNRFSILDIPNGYEPRKSGVNCIDQFRNGIGNDYLSFGAAYYPWLDRAGNQHSLSYKNLDPAVNLSELLPEPKAQEALTSNQVSQENIHLALWSTSLTYQRIIESMAKILKPSPPSGAIAGIYSQVDSTRGVWKAPANVSLSGFEKPSVAISPAEQETLKVDSYSGKSINALRLFPGEGILVWGARTLAGNDNEWRYVPVKRTALMIKQSTENYLQQFAFEPNDANTWARIKLSVSDFLIELWRKGALFGTKPEHSFFVKIGLGETMTSQDILEGKGILVVGLALVKPAEFISLKFEIAFN
ncbi:phage tail sheath family protein [Algoriphagus lacus]|nr:phage tail sheath C-terminal domain-containing protein [Algoriphagus lacus]